MSTSELVRQLALARANKVLQERSTGAGGVLMGGKVLKHKYKKKARVLRRARQTNVQKKSGRKINLYAELLHACGKKKASADIASGKYVKTTGLSGKKLISARHMNKRAINRCIGHKLQRGTFSKKRYKINGGEFDNPIGGAYSGGDCAALEDRIINGAPTMSELRQMVYESRMGSNSADTGLGFGGAYSGGDCAALEDRIINGAPTMSELRQMVYESRMGSNSADTGLGFSKKKKRSPKSSRWIAYVKKYAKAKGINYQEALQRAGPSYHKMYG